MLWFSGKEKVVCLCSLWRARQTSAYYELRSLQFQCFRVLKFIMKILYTLYDKTVVWCSYDSCPGEVVVIELKSGAVFVCMWEYAYRHREQEGQGKGCATCFLWGRKWAGSDHRRTTSYVSELLLLPKSKINNPLVPHSSLWFDCFFDFVLFAMSAMMLCLRRRTT